MRSRATELVEAPRPGELFTAIITEEHRPGAFRQEMHPGFELVVLLGGRQQRHTDQHTSVLMPGEVVLVQAWEPHSWRPMAPNTTALVIYFMSGFLGELRFNQVHWLSLFAAAPERRPGVVGQDARRRLLGLGQEMRSSAPSTLREEVDATAVHLLGEPLDERPPAWETAFRLWVSQILLLLYQNWEHREEAASRPQASSRDLARILPALRMGMGDGGEAMRVDLAEAAEACGLSTSQFRSIFQRIIGVSFGRFDLRRRLVAAARLLTTTSESVQEIAERCGFTDRSHLHRMFVQRYGKTPAGYRDDSGITAGTEGR